MKDENLGRFKKFHGTNPDGTKNGITYILQSMPEFDDPKPMKVDLVWNLPKGLGEDLEIPEVKWDMTPPMWKVWTEGYSATGEHGTATYHGEVRAETFVEACKILLGDSLDRESSGELRMSKDGNPSVWACRCYDNEVDARKSFG